MWRLLYPLRYFRLLNNEKRGLDLWPTAFLAALITLPYAFITGTSFFEPAGFLDHLLTLTSCLTGFYVAALVAAATFAHPDLDKVITSGSIALVTKDSDGHRVQEALSRREFACYIFGYLSYLSLALSIFCAVAVSVANAKVSDKFRLFSYQLTVPHEVLWPAKTLLIFAFSLMVAHLFVATSLGLYYLMDRLYRNDRKIITKKIEANRTDAA